MARQPDRGASARRRQSGGVVARTNNAALRQMRKAKAPRSGRPPVAPLLYLLRHVQAAAAVLDRARRTPLHTAMTTAVIGIALALPAAFLVVLDNLERLTGGWEDGTAQISLFLAHDLTGDEVAARASEITARRGVAGVRVITPDEALEAFRADSDLDAALDLLDANPLPSVLVVTADSGLGAQAVAGLAEALASEAGVERMRLDQAWLERLYAMMTLAERAVWVVASLLALAVVLVVGNTIRMTIERRRDEIEIVKLIGATNGFVRRPFLYEGVWYGLVGGVLAWSLTVVGRWSVAAPSQRLAETYNTEFSLVGLGFENGLGLLLSGALLGLLGAWTAVARHLAAIEPR